MSHAVFIAPLDQSTYLFHHSLLSLRIRSGFSVPRSVRSSFDLVGATSNNFLGIVYVWDILAINQETKRVQFTVMITPSQVQCTYFTYKNYSRITVQENIIYN